MRVTAQKKQETRRQILEATSNLLQEKGFDQTTTRDIAAAARVAAGTVFNYFASKEALVVALVAEALDDAAEAFETRLRGDESLDEALFAHVAVGLRHLAPHRPYVGRVLEVASSPLATSGACPQAEQIRAEHLEAVGRLIGTHGGKNAASVSFVTMHLYWTLYLGVLAFWSSDESPRQEDTLVVLDQAMRMFAASLADARKIDEEVTDVTENR